MDTTEVKLLCSLVFLFHLLFRFRTASPPRISVNGSFVGLSVRGAVEVQHL